jgi:hypothetical protein
MIDRPITFFRTALGSRRWRRGRLGSWGLWTGPAEARLTHVTLMRRRHELFVRANLCQRRIKFCMRFLLQRRRRSITADYTRFRGDGGSFRSRLVRRRSRAGFFPQQWRPFHGHARLLRGWDLWTLGRWHLGALVALGGARCPIELRTARPVKWGGRF